MKIFKRRAQTMVIGLVLTYSAIKLNASVTYTIGNGGLQPVYISLTDVYSGNALAGGISIRQGGGPEYISVCTDVGATLYLGQSYAYDGPILFNNLSPAGGINPKWGTGDDGGGNGSWAKAIQNAAYIFNTYGNLVAGGSLAGGGGLGGDLNQKTAIQLAVWDVLYNTLADGSVNGTRFSFGANAEVTGYVNLWTAGLTGNYGIAGSLLVPNPIIAGVNANANGESPQELLIQAPSGITSQVVTTVPETTTIIAGALLLLPLGASTFRILNKRRGAQ